MLIGAAFACGLLACDNRHGEQVKDAVSGQGCRDVCTEQLKQCNAGCSDDVCRSDCTADSRMCSVQCSMPADAGVDAGSASADRPRPSRPSVMDAGAAEVDIDSGTMSSSPVAGLGGAAGAAGGGAAGAAAGGGGQASGAGGYNGAGMGGMGAMAGAGLPFAGSSGIPVAGRDLPVAGLTAPIAGRRGPFAGDAP